MKKTFFTRMKPITTAAILMVTLSASNLHNVHAAEDLYSLSLQELMNVKIFTANQEEETIAESPSVTSVITSEQLQQWGVQNLYEALSYLPGIVTNETYMGYSVPTFRGVTPGLYNSKVLFMINGHPAYERLFGSGHVEYVPLEMIERIEVVRSPASVLYGSNAISGVVNIITKQKAGSNQTKFRVGSHAHTYLSAQHHSERFNIGMSVLRDNGYRFFGTNDERGMPVDLDYTNDLDNVFVSFHNNDWRIDAAFFQLSEMKYGLNTLLNHNGLNHQESWYLDLNRSMTLNEGTLNVWLRADSFDKALHAQNFPAPSDNPVTVVNQVKRYSAEAQYKQSVSTALSYIVGMNYDHDHTDPFIFRDDITGEVRIQSPITSEHDFDNIAMYGQVRYQANASILATLGVRIENNSDTGGSGLIPRLGITYKVTDSTYVKALYSEAFRAPVFLDKYSNVPGIISGDINLEREKIQTTEISVDSQLNDNNSIQVTAFYLDLNDEITRRPATGGGTEYYNSPGREMYGLEMQWLATLNQQINLFFNASYQNGKEVLFDDAPFIANFTANSVINYRLNDSWQTSLSLKHVGSQDYILSNYEVGRIEAYSLINWVLAYSSDRYQFNITMRNVLDERYEYPEPVRRNVASIPGGDGASLYFDLVFKY